MKTFNATIERVRFLCLELQPFSLEHSKCEHTVFDKAIYQIYKISQRQVIILMKYNTAQALDYYYKDGYNLYAKQWVAST